MPHPSDDQLTYLCRTDRCPSCTGRLCACPCHRDMTLEYAASIILRAAGHRLWPDDRAEQLELVDAARKVDPFDPELDRALRVLGLS